MNSSLCKILAAVWLVLAFMLGWAAHARFGAAAPPVQVEITYPTEFVERVNRDLAELRRAVGLDGPEARPEGLQWSRQAAKGAKE